MAERDRTAIQARLRAFPLFGEIPDDLLGLVASRVEVRAAPSGAVLFRAGDSGNEFLVITEGRVRISVPDDAGAEEAVAELDAGAWFGEMALITGEPRSATARATEDTVLLALSHDAFHELLGRHAPLALAMSQELSRRLRARLLRRGSGPRPRLYLLEDSSPSEATARNASRLARAMAGELGAPVALLDLAGAPPVALEAGDGASDDGRRVVKLPVPRSVDEMSQAIAAHELVVVRLAPGHALAEALRRRRGASVEPTLLRDLEKLDDDGGSGLLASPLQARVRGLLRRRVGLALGAGGAKGLAHVGALRAFQRAGLRFDVLAGSSIGAAVATMVALDWPPERIHDFLERLCADFRRQVIDLGIPSGSLLKGRKKKRLLERESGDRRLEDLPVPVFMVAADLNSGREFVLDRGPVAEALDATTALPPVFPAVQIGERRLVDGWVVNPFPTDVLRRRGADVVVGVDPNVADDPATRRASRPARKKSWTRWLNPRHVLDPAGMLKVAMQALDVGARERTLANVALADVCVKPPLGAYSFTAIHKMREIVDVGQAAAEAAIPDIERSIRRAGRPGTGD